MKTLLKHILLFAITISLKGYSQNNKKTDYIEFNDRNNILHGIYIGVDVGYGLIDGKNDVSIVGAKLAYVANKKMELGIALRTFYSRLNEVDKTFNNDFNVFGIYGGFHLENVIFNNKKIKLSIPGLIGIGYIEGSENFTKSSDMMLVVEPGINALFNVNKYIQLESGLKYRISSPIDPVPTVINHINGFSIGMGVKVGIFNLGKNRYKKQLKTI